MNTLVNCSTKKEGEVTLYLPKLNPRLHLTPLNYKNA